MELYSMVSFKIGFFSSTYYPYYPSKMLHVSVACSFSLLSSIPATCISYFALLRLDLMVSVASGYPCSDCLIQRRLVDY